MYICREEYENEDHLRRNMVLLLTKLMKEEKKRQSMPSLTQHTEQAATIFGEVYPGPYSGPN